MKQDIPFDTSRGGTVKNLCLDNVRRGFGIANKYGSAWEAWQHTQQHTGSPPDGLDVPLFYSYTATIDGETRNWGHINVQLKDGTVWSDGNIYASINAYTANHSPRYVGWGESVNDFKILEGIEQGETMNHNAGTEAYVTVFHRNAENPQVADQWNGESPEGALKRMRDEDEWKAIEAKLNNYGNLVNQVADLSARPTKEDLQKVLDQFNAEHQKVIELESKPTPTSPDVKPPVTSQSSGFWTSLIKFLKGQK